MAGRVFDVVTLGVLLVAATLAVVALNVNWAKADFGTAEPGMRALSIRNDVDGSIQQAPYSSDDLDELEGIGMARSGGVLFLIGTLVLGMAVLLAEHRLMLAAPWIPLATAATAGVGAIVLIVGMVLLPIGIKELVQDGGGLPGEVNWRFGLFAAIAAGAAALTGTVLAGLSAMRAAGVRIELAEPAKANFD